MEKRWHLFWYVVLGPVVIFLWYLSTNYHVFQGLCERAGDYALLAINVEKAKNLEALTGPYSRFRFQHPGPITFYLYAIAEIFNGARLPFQASWMVAQLVLNFFFLVVAGAVIYRNSSSRLLTPIFFLLVFFTFRTMGREYLFNVWNPSVTVFPMLALIVFLAALGKGERIHIFGVALSFLLVSHNHIGAFLFAIALIGVGFVLMSNNRSRDTVYPVPVEVTALVCGVLVLVLCSLPPLYEAYSNPGGGNGGRIIEYLLASRDGIGLEAALSFISGIYTAPLRPLVKGWEIPVFLLLLVIPFGARRERGEFESNLRGLLASGAIFAVLIASRIEGKPYGYLMWFLYGAVALQYLMVIATLVSIVSPFVESAVSFRIRQTLSLASVVVLIAFALLSSRYVPPVEGEECSGARDKLFSFVAPEPGANHFVMIDQDARWQTAASIVSRLQRAGFSVCVDRGWAFMFGDSIACTRSPQAGDLLLRFRSGFERPSPHEGEVFKTRSLQLLRVRLTKPLN